jgi:hypothetical protein
VKVEILAEILVLDVYLREILVVLQILQLDVVTVM